MLLCHVLVLCGCVWSQEEALVDWTCDDCAAWIPLLIRKFTSLSAVALETKLLAAELCPFNENPKDCSDYVSCKYHQSPPH